MSAPRAEKSAGGIVTRPYNLTCFDRAPQAYLLCDDPEIAAKSIAAMRAPSRTVTRTIIRRYGIPIAM